MLKIQVIRLNGDIAVSFSTWLLEMVAKCMLPGKRLQHFYPLNTVTGWEMVLW